MKSTGLTPVASTTVSLSNTTAKSTALGTGIVRLYSTVDVFIKFGDSTVTAATTDMFLPGGTIEYFNAGTVLSGASTVPKTPYIAGILSSGTGTLYITTMQEV